MRSVMSYLDMPKYSLFKSGVDEFMGKVGFHQSLELPACRQIAR
jgi:hypothetical protein